MLHSFSAPVAIHWSRGTAHIGDVERALEEMQTWGHCATAFERAAAVAF